MSQKKQPQGAIVLKTSLGGVQRFKIDGHEFAVDFDDAHKIHAFFTFRGQCFEIIHGIDSEKATPEESAEAFNAAAALSEKALDTILGDGAYQRIFEGQRPVVRGMALIAKLSEYLGPAYDALFADYAK